MDGVEVIDQDERWWSTLAPKDPEIIAGEVRAATATTTCPVALVLSNDLPSLGGHTVCI